MVERTYLEKTKQQTRCLRKGNNGIFGLCQEESKVECMY